MKYNYQKFHQSVKLDKFITTPKKQWPAHWIKIDYKGYPRFEHFKLDKPKEINFNIYDALMKRYSQREYAKVSVIDQLSDFLYYSVGMRNGKRMYASAGGRYPCETYIIIGRDLYHYHVKSHSLEKMWRLKTKALKQAISMKWAMKAPVLILVSGVFPRTTNKYKDRGFLYVNQEVGAIWQTMQLVATSLGLGSCSIGGFMDDDLNQMLDLDGEVESVMSLMTLGLSMSNLKGGDSNE